MKGVIFNIVEDTVSEHRGEDVWDQLLLDAGVDHGHTALGDYSDEEMMTLIAAAAAALDMTQRAVMCWVGERAAVHFFKRYPYYFEPHNSARSLLPALDEIIHPEVRKLYSDAHPPSFDCATAEDGDMTVVYSSHRPMCGLAEGLMLGVAELYHESLVIEHPECVEKTAVVAGSGFIFPDGKARGSNGGTRSAALAAARQTRTRSADRSGNDRGKSHAGSLREQYRTRREE